MTSLPPNPNKDSVPFDSGYFPVGDIHKLYYEQHGNKTGKPVIFLHGGPGARATLTKNLIFFDLTVLRVVLLDQRGAGKSLPFADLRENTSQHLVSDIEVLRTRLSIRKWHIVFGGSWGSTLALLYAQTHPAAVSSMVLRGIFLASSEELRWLYDSGTSTAHSLNSIFPEVKARWYAHLIAAGEDVDHPIDAYYRLLTSDDEAVARAAAREWARPELTTVALRVDPADVDRELEDIEFLLPFSRIEASYFKHGAWLRDGQLLEREAIDRIRHIPTAIVQGRYDVVCPAKYAWMLYRALNGGGGGSESDSGTSSNKCELYFTIAGHDKFELETLVRSIEICKRYGEMEF